MLEYTVYKFEQTKRRDSIRNFKHTKFKLSMQKKFLKNPSEKKSTVLSLVENSCKLLLVVHRDIQTEVFRVLWVTPPSINGTRVHVVPHDGCAQRLYIK